MKTKTLQEATKAGLIPIYIWVNSDKLDWIKSEYDRLVSLNPKRKVMIVEYRNRFTIYATDMSL